VLSIGELEAAIVRDPDDVELRRVYADALQETGDPRGDHLALAFLAAKGDVEAAARVRILELAASERLRQRLEKDYVVRLTWRLGFVEHVDIDGREAPDKFPRGKLRELIEQRELLALRGLDLRGIWNTEWSPSRQLGLLPALVAGRPVRWLGIGDGPIDAAVIEELRKALPGLTGLGVLTTKPRSARMALRDLRDVELASRKISSIKLVASLIETLTPELDRLVLHGMDDRITADAFAPILKREVFPKLRHLGVFGPHGLTWDFLRALVDSPLLPELESLGFCAAEMWDDDESEEWLKEHGRRFAHLRLFSSAWWPDDDNAHESGRLGLVLKKIDRAAEAVPEIEHHLQFSGNEKAHRACWEELAEAMVWAGRPEEALEPLDTAIKLFKNKVTDDSIYTFRTRAEALDALERWEEARETCVRALAYEEDNSWTHRHHGRALRELGRLDEALAAFKLAIQHGVDEDDDDRPDVLGWAYVEQGRTLWELRRTDAAIGTFAKARLHGEVTAKRAAWWAESAILRQRGHVAEARVCLERASQDVNGTELESPLYELGETLYELGDFEGALAVWQRGAALYSGWTEIEEQTYALLALGRADQALAVAEAARRHEDAARAFALHALGRTDEAIAAVEDYGHRTGLGEPVCVYRQLAGPLLQAGFHRAAGREDEARSLFAKARRAERDPRALHAVVASELGGTDGCDQDLCGRPAAAAALAAALALGDREDATARARAIGAAIENGSCRLMPTRIWEVREALSLLGVDAALAEATLTAIERCTGLVLVGATSTQ
jgi:uncharacterized protein (TIGR02996 family)